jgi:hypothetical protein
MAASKLRTGTRQELAEDTTLEDRAVLDLATDVLGDLGLLGPAMILLAGRNCSPRCTVSARSHRMANGIMVRWTNGFWPLEGPP